MQASSCTMPALHYTKPWEAEFPYNETVTYECLDGYRLGSTVYGAATFLVFCGADGLVTTFGVCGPVSCGEPISVPNAVLSNRAYHFPEHAFCVCDLVCSTSGLASGLLSFHSALQKDGAFVTPSFCRAVSCGTPVENHGNVAPGRSATLATKGYTTRQGDTSVGSGSHAAGTRAALAVNGVLKSLFLAATPKRRELQCEQLLHVVRLGL